MARIKTKNSTTSTSIPASGSLLRGELAVNIADQRIFIGDASGNPVELTSQTVVNTSGVAGVSSISSNPSGVYVSQSSGAVTLGLDPDIYVSGSIHVSGVSSVNIGALNLFASENPTTSWSHWITGRSYNNTYSEIAGNDNGDLIFRTQSNNVAIEPTGSLAVTIDTFTASTGYLYPTPNDVRIGNANTTTTFPGNVTITKALTVDHITGDMDGAVLKACKNTDSVTLRKGDPVFISGNVGASDVIEIQLARADTTAKMPAVGLCAQSLAVNATGYVVVVGALSSTDTSEFTVGNSVYVNSTGWVTNVRPTGASILVQNIGRVARSNVSNGQIIVLGPGRTNDVPNNILASGTLTLGTPDIITPLVGTASVFNTNVSRVNIGASASGVLIGNATGVVVVGDAAVNNGAITTTATTATLFNATAARVNIGGGASGVQIGHPTGTVVVGNIAANSGTISTTALAGDIFNATAARINIGAGASGVLIGHATGVVTVGDLAVNDGTISTTATGVSIFDATALRVNIGGGASGVQIGHPTGTVVMGNIAANSGTISTTATSANIFNTTAARVNIGGGASGVLIGNATGVVTVGDIAVNNGAITTTATTATLFNATAARVNIGGGASGVQIGHPTGMVVMGNIAVSGNVNTNNILSSGFQLSLNDKVDARVAIGDYSGNGSSTYIYLRENINALYLSNPYGDILIGDPGSVDSGYFIAYNAAAGYLDGAGSTLTNWIGGSFSGLLTASGISATGTIAATFNGLVDMNFNTLVEPTLKYYNEVLASPTISANVLTLDLSTAQVFTVSLNANITTLTISNTPATANRSIGFTLIFTADGTARTVTWGSAVKWANNDPPTLTSTNGKKDILSFVSPDGGTNWYGFIGGLNF